MARSPAASRTYALVRAAATGDSIPHAPGMFGIAVESLFVSTRASNSR
jgi:hypothetical protein